MIENARSELRTFLLNPSSFSCEWKKETGQYLGESAKGEVFIGQYKDKGEDVAIKRFRTPIKENIKLQDAIKQEKIIFSFSLDQGLVPYLGMFLKGNQLCIASSLVSGQDIGQLVNSGLTYPPEHRLQAMRNVAKAVHLLHQNGIAHGGLKPSNILVYGDNKVVVSDYGQKRLAKSLLGAGQSSTTVGENTITSIKSIRFINQKAEYIKNQECKVFWYMSPEELDPRKVSDINLFFSDVYSFAIILWEVINKRLPFNTVSKVEHLQLLVKQARPSSSHLKDAAKQLLYKCWMENPKERKTFQYIESALNSLSPDHFVG